jgi:hypothetical protein
MFRIQNDDVIERAKTKAKSKAKARAKAEAHSLSFSDVASEEPGKTAIVKDARRFFCPAENEGYWASFTIPTRGPAPTIEQRARCYFQAHAADWLRNSDLIEDLVIQTNGDEHLLASITAAGLASFSNSVHSPELMTEARRRYGAALGLTNAALRSPTEAKKDSTLFAVMILGVFETLAGNNAQSLLAWAEHVNGAAALVKLRGLDQFRTDAGQRMFYQVTGNLVVTCIQRITPMPAHIIDLRKAAEGMVDTSSQAWMVSSIIIDFTIFQAAVHDRRLVGPRAIVEAALAIDQHFLAACSDVAPDWQYQVMHTDEAPHLVWNKTYYAYHNAWAAQLWNGMRTCRVLLHEIICDQLLSSASAITPIFTEAEAAVQEQSSASIMQETARDILCSIPHHVPVSQSADESSLLTGFRSSLILWPLYLVGAMDTSSEEVRDWAVARLRVVEAETGIRHAGLMAGYLNRRQEVYSRKPGRRPLEDRERNHWMSGPQIEESGARVWEF